MNNEWLMPETLEFDGEFDSEFDGEGELDGEFPSEEWEDESRRRRRQPPRRRGSTRLPQRRGSTRLRAGVRGRRRSRPWLVRVQPPSEYVRWVQTTLNQIMDLRLPADGVMGAATRSALRSFQQQQGLLADGLAGPETERALLDARGGQAPPKRVSPPAEPEPPDESAGQSGEPEPLDDGAGQPSEPEPPETEYPEFSIEPFTFNGEFDGEFSNEEWEDESRGRRQSPSRPQSTRLPRRRRSTQPRAGVRGRWRARAWPIYVQPPSEYVRWVQSTLNQIMDLRLPEDGLMGPALRSALRNFQEQQGLPVDGIVGPDTARALRIAGAGQPAPVAANEQEAFLGSLWPFGDEAQIEDRTQFTPKAKRVQGKDRAQGKVYALVLHQMAFSRGNNPTKYDNVTAHFAILPDGKILQLHPISAYLNASNGFNPGSVAVEFAGNFPNTKGKCWEAKKFGCHKVTQAQIEAGRKLVKHLIKTIGLTHILAHRQSSGTRENDPGPDLWYHVGQWAVDNLGLKDGGPGFWIKNRIAGGQDGQPIPDEWRTWGRGSTTSGSTTPELEAEFSLSEFPGAVLDVARKGLEGAALQLAVRWGIQDENKLANLIFFIRHAERNGRKLERSEPDFARLSQEWSAIRDRLVRPLLQTKAGGPTPSSPSTGSKQPAWVNELTPLLNQYRGDIPLDFLLGWIAIESGGRNSITTYLNERGYFQIHPDESKMLRLDHQRLSSDREYSIQSGIRLVQYFAQRVKQLGFPYGTDLFWHVVKLLHWLPCGVQVILADLKAQGVRPTTWAEFRNHVQSRQAELERIIKEQCHGKWKPMDGIANVEKLFQHARQLTTP